MTPAISFIGLGLMGQPMVKRLLAAGHRVRVWNRDPAKMQPLVAAGAQAAASLTEAAHAADVLMLCVSDTAAVEAVVFGEQGLAAHAQAGAVLVDFSSIDPAATRAFAARLATEAGVRWGDVPVSGGVRGAETGQLVMMAGGEAADVDALRPLLAVLGQRVTHMGTVGAGQVTKVCNQLIVAANSVLIAEAITLAEAAGVDASRLAPALAGGFADSLPLQILAPRMSAHSYTPVQWKVATLLKDLGNAARVAAAHQHPCPLAALAERQLQAHAEAGFAQQDLSTLAEHYR